MADEKENPASATAMPRVRRRAPTIELKATEVAVEPPPPPEPSESSAAPETEHPVPPDYPTEPPSYEMGGSEPPQEPPPPQPKQAGSSFFSHPMVAAGLAGGLVAIVILIALALAGLFSGGNAPSDQRLAQIEAQLRDIANRPPPPRAPETRATDELNARLTKLENAASRPDNNVAPVGISDEALKSLQAAISDLARRIDDSAAAARAARDQADAALVAADAARVAAEKSNVDPVNARVTALENTSKKLSDDVAKTLAAAGGDKPLRTVVAAQALRAAVDRGDSFASELAAVKTSAANPQTLAPLEPFAANGLPSAAVLSRQFSDLAQEMLKRAAPPPPSGGFLDRLQANAEKLVRIRPIEEVPGDEPAAIISRAQAKITRADFSGALTELKALPADLRAPAEDWIKKVEARQAAVNASNLLVSDALAGLGKPAP